MKLPALVTTYIQFKRDAGMRFRADGGVLKAFARAMGDVDIAAVTPDAVRRFLAGKGPITAFWHQKHAVLNGFYRYAISRGLAETSPLPDTVPERPPVLVPYVYSPEELRRMLAATDQLHNPISPLQADTMRVLLLLLYSTGMRISEALALTLADVVLVDSLITVRHAKFHKVRWIPVGPQMTAQLAAYARARRNLALPNGEASAFFATRTGHPLSYDRTNDLFGRVRTLAGIHRDPQARYQPRIHDLRHTSAVHHVIRWYRQGENVQSLLPHLATYLGHVDVASTQRYLSMTSELLNEASWRFEQYARRETPHE